MLALGWVLPARPAGGGRRERWGTRSCCRRCKRPRAGALTAAWLSTPREPPPQLVRRALALPNAPAVVSMHAMSWWEAKPRGMGDAPATPAAFYRTGEDDPAVIAQFYDLPVLSVRWAGRPLRALPREGARSSSASCRLLSQRCTPPRLAPPQERRV